MSILGRGKHSFGVLALIAQLGFSTAYAQQQMPSQDSDGFMPEIYLYDPNQPSCILRADFYSDAIEERQQQLLSGIDIAYATTQGWQKEFGLAGIDYLDFRYAHVVAYRSCSNSDDLIARLSPMFGTERSEWRILRSSNLLSTVKELDELGPVGSFIRYRSKSQIQPCLIRFFFPNIEAAIARFKHLHILLQKYRFPIADISLMDRNSYLLLSRSCGEKQEMYEQLLFLLRREDIETEELGSADLDPAPYEFFSMNQCQFGLGNDDDFCKP